MAAIGVFVVICGAMMIKAFLSGDERAIITPSSSERLYSIDENVYYGNPAQYDENENYLFNVQKLFLFLKQEQTSTMFNGNSSSEIMTEVVERIVRSFN